MNKQYSGALVYHQGTFQVSLQNKKVNVIGQNIKRLT